MSLPIKVEGIEEGDTRPGDEFRFTSSPTAWASSTFTAIVPDGAIVTRRLPRHQSLPIGMANGALTPSCPPLPSSRRRRRHGRRRRH
jgi:hypothetical protein